MCQTVLRKKMSKRRESARVTGVGKKSLTEGDIRTKM
jgi:hypothetical protein